MEGFLKPEEILKQLDLKEDMIAADFGSGSGGWALPLAQILKEGKVYAIDILEEPLSALKSRAAILKIFNIAVMRSDIETKNGSGLKDNHLDLVLITNLLFEAEDKKEVLAEGKRVLKKGGKILVVDWKKDATLGPKQGRVSAQEVKEIAVGLDFKLEKELEAGSYHYGLVFTKP
ncbi:class I SAM-dependent methyltransferase [Patescibacteria group bacterium]|nr:class I SAM-dependent methyltransferase [Patescibacteria group bacterium]